MIRKISNYFIKQNTFGEDDREVFEYGIFVIGFNLLCMISVFIIGWFIIDINFACLYLLFYSPIRMLLGGYHCKTPTNCFLLTSGEAFILFILLDIFNNQLVMMITILLMIVCTLIYLFEDHYRLYKLILTGLVVVYLMIINKYQLVICSIFLLNSLSYLYAKVKK